MPETTRLKGIEQGRAQAAYQYASEASAKPYCGDYKSYARKIPMLIKMNGLGATLAFMKAKAKSKPAYNLVYEHVTGWLRQDQKHAVALSGDLVETVIALDSAQYRAVTAEVLAFLTWLRRFAEGLIAEEADES